MLSKRKPSKKRIVICEKCNKEFETRHSQAKYCPSKCRREGERDSWNKYGQRNRKQRRKYYKGYYKKNRKKIITKTTAYHKSEAGKKAIKISDKRQREKYPEKYQAREAVLKALRKGVLKKKPCEECGIKKVEAHHEDYSKPLKVKWLCHKHHRIIEKRYVKKIN